MVEELPARREPQFPESAGSGARNLGRDLPALAVLQRLQFAADQRERPAAHGQQLPDRRHRQQRAHRPAADPDHAGGSHSDGQRLHHQSRSGTGPRHRRGHQRDDQVRHQPAFTARLTSSCRTAPSMRARSSIRPSATSPTTSSAATSADRSSTTSSSSSRITCAPMDHEANTNQTNIPSDAFRTGRSERRSRAPWSTIPPPACRMAPDRTARRSPATSFPPSRINPVSAKILAFLPATNETFSPTSQTNDYFALLPVPEDQRPDRFQSRLDRSPIKTASAAASASPRPDDVSRRRSSAMPAARRRAPSKTTARRRPTAPG